MFSESLLDNGDFDLDGELRPSRPISSFDYLFVTYINGLVVTFVSLLWGLLKQNLSEVLSFIYV